MKQVLKPLGAFFLWNLLAGAALLHLPPSASIPVAALLFLGFLYGYVLRGGRPGEARRWADLRLRPLRGGALRATLAAVPVLLLLVWALASVWMQLVPIPPESLHPFERVTRTPLGRLALSLLAVASAPLLEEFVFRGLMQRPLERRWGPRAAISVTAAVFALFHFLPWIFPVHLLLGLAFGFAVYATRSIWAGVILHAANNAVALLTLGSEAPEPVPTVWETGITPELRTALVVLVLASALALRVARWLWREGHQARRAALTPRAARASG
jgi:membrane protease YdiL (CAAX protease family)